ncbi:MAG: retropepsin-like aspartic protease, partial [Robiginitalea sp.]
MPSLKKHLKQKGFVPVKLSRTQTDHFEVKATLNGVSGSFILDTGASNTCVALDKAERFGLISEPTDILAAGA